MYLPIQSEQNRHVILEKFPFNAIKAFLDCFAINPRLKYVAGNPGLSHAFLVETFREKLLHIF